MALTIPKVDKKIIQAISFDIYKTREDIDITFEKINHYGLQYLLCMDNNGIISNILINAIERNDSQTIELIRNQSNLMKRDILKLIKYYKDNPKILLNLIDRVVPLITGEDLSWIISNNLTQILEKCIGKFLVMDNKDFKIIPDIESDIRLEVKTLNQELCESIKSSIVKKIDNPKIFTKIKSDPKQYNIIIDGGNVIHSLNGRVSGASYIILEKIIEQCKSKFGNVLLVIHKLHWKKHPKIVDIVTKSGIDYYISPPNYYDDLFIMWYYVCNPNSYIVSNDKFSDHFYYLNQDPQFKYISTERVLNYSIKKSIEIANPKTVSLCIQKIEDTIWIPCEGGWVKI